MRKKTQYIVVNEIYKTIYCGYPQKRAWKIITGSSGGMYKKTFDMKIGRMFKEIFSGILPCGLVSAAIVFGIGEVVPFSIPAFFIKGFAFVILYGGLLLKFGLKDSEKKMIPGLSKICL